VGKEYPHYMEEYLVTFKDERIARINRAGQIVYLIKSNYGRELNRTIRRIHQGHEDEMAMRLTVTPADGRWQESDVSLLDFLTEDQHERLRQVAFEQRTSIASLLREAAMEILEDYEDLREGLEALADEEGTVSWREYRQRRRVGEQQGDL